MDTLNINANPAPLPKSRAQDAHRFTSTNVDFNRALYTRSGSEDVKVYVCLFMCATSIAIHLKVVKDLSNTTFCWPFVSLLVVDHY